MPGSQVGGNPVISDASCFPNSGFLDLKASVCSSTAGEEGLQSPGKV